MAHLKDNLTSPVAPLLALQVQPVSPDPTVARPPLPRSLQSLLIKNTGSARCLAGAWLP